VNVARRRPRRDGAAYPGFRVETMPSAGFR
jgi:hypothetical protein